MRITAAALACLLTVMSCGGGPPLSGASDEAVVTTGVVMDIFSRVVMTGGATLLVPFGADPHEHELVPAAAAEVFDADLVIAIGGGFEGFADVLEAAKAEGVRVIELISVVDPIIRDGVPDPHFWLDPVRVEMAARFLAEELQVRVDTGVEDLARDMAHVQAQVNQMLSEIPPERRKIVTGHDFLAYFAERFDLEVVGVIVPGGTPHAEPSSEHLAEIVDIINREKITAIFVDAGESTALAEAVAAEADHPVEVVELWVEAIPDLASPSSDLIRITGERIARALGN